MVHAFRLIEATGLVEEGSRLWGAVYLHDLARTHDGFCEVHGMHAVLRVNESTDLQERLIAHGVQSDDPSMLLAVMMHCLPDDHSAYGGKPIWPLLSLLKDADALDRVRFGDLEPNFLRWEATRQMVGFAQDLYNQTRRIKEGPSHFLEVVRVAERLLGRQLPIPATVLASPAMKGRRPVYEPLPASKGAKATPAPKAGKAEVRTLVKPGRPTESRAAAKAVAGRVGKGVGRLASKAPVKPKPRRRVGAAR